MSVLACILAVSAALLAAYLPLPTTPLLACYPSDFTLPLIGTPNPLTFGSVTKVTAHTRNVTVSLLPEAEAGDYHDYSLAFEYAGEPVCLESDSDGYCIEEAPTLCDYLTYESVEVNSTPLQGSNGQLEHESNPTDTWRIELRAPCIESGCTNPLPRELANTELSCDLVIGPPLASCRHTVPTAYAEEYGDRVRITATVTDTQPATLTLVPTAPYVGARGVVSSGPYPERGVADKDTFTFTVLYIAPIAPQTMAAYVGTSPTDQPTLLPLTLDQTAAPEYRDGVYTNGEQYTASSTFPKDKYFFSFRATTTNGTPVILSDPNPTHLNNTLTFEAGYSSVVFLPGIQGTRLIEENLGPDDELWLPLNGNEVRRLAMDEQGMPVNRDVYVGDIIDEAYPLLPGERQVYGPFLNYMHGIALQGLIKAFVPLPYDWRHDVLDVVTEPVKRGMGSSESMSTALLRISQASDSGRIILIGHSNGGLVGKALIQSLSEIKASNLVEKFVMVGVPQTGTPKAVLALLHGSMNIPLFAATSTIRVASRNMPGAYGLLPLGTYDLTSTRIITFEQSTLTEPYRRVYGESVDSASELDTFLLGGEGRPDPEEESLNEPLVLTPGLVAKAQVTRTFLESWVAPDDVEVVEFAGGNLPTIDRLLYKNRVDCIGGAAKCLLVDPIRFGSGDGTVVLSSAQWYAADRGYVIDMWAPGALEHATMLNNSDLQHMLSDLISTSSPTLRPWIYPKGSPLPYPDIVVLKAFSPVTLTVTNPSGIEVRRSNPAQGLETIDGSIPQVQYLSLGEMQMIIAPANSKHTVTITGTATGTLQLEFTEHRGASRFRERIHPNINVTPALTATATLTALDSMGSVYVDTDGNGVSDNVLVPLTVSVLISELKAYIRSTNLPQLAKLVLLAQVQKLEQELARQNKQQVLHSIRGLKFTLFVDTRLKLITATQRTILFEYVVQLEKLIIGN